MKQFQSTRSGCVVKQATDYNAFIPNSLLPNGPELKISWDCMGLLAEAERALGELNGITENLPDPDLFVGFYVQKEALLSSQIEGTQCSLDEVIQIDEATQSAKPVDEVVNYIKAMNYGLAKLKSLPLSIRLINEIHTQLLDGVRGTNKSPGEFRRTQNWIGPAGCTLKEAAYVPPPPHLVMEAMGDLEKYYHEEDAIPILIKAALIHAQFETIHPYLDGNGRLGRLLITFALCEKKVMPQPLLYLSLFFKEHRSAYYEHLMKVRTDGAWEEWIEFFLRGVRNTSIEATKAARDILDLQKIDREKISKNIGSYKIAFACYDYLCRKPISTITEVVEHLDSNYPSVKKVFDGFATLNILSPYGEKERNKMFQYHEYLNILRRGT